MPDLEINVTQVEEWQTLGDRDALEQLFARAERVIIGGGEVILVRAKGKGKGERFDTITTEDDLKTYREQVFKYL